MIYRIRLATNYLREGGEGVRFKREGLEIAKGPYPERFIQLRRNRKLRRIGLGRVIADGRPLTQPQVRAEGRGVSVGKGGDDQVECRFAPSAVRRYNLVENNGTVTVTVGTNGRRRPPLDIVKAQTARDAFLSLFLLGPVLKLLPKNNKELLVA